MDIDLLVKLTSRAWAFKALALIHEGIPARQAPLLAASGASRTTFVNSLRYLEDLELLERNPGHGHPLRPEFRLTAKGLALAPLAHQIERQIKDEADAALIRKTWTLPLLAVTHAPKAFSVIKRDLGAITDRALSHTLQELSEHHWIERHVEAQARPPRPYYHAVETGAKISKLISLRA
ncbi:winged helix-turn-helix transcriptional regulator [Woodsholea maritima]|uniref:winged helix-turn-helix transcriptional regulator n=1 Tax=Woodsholea maritima TaxID=240237 RepID=UPI0003680A82|nr:winged helix-turn-helix transcriptional regulator [Woodsholea maritima]